MNKPALDKCTHEERRIIEINYSRVMHNEITVPAFFSEAYRLLGPKKFADVFPNQARNLRMQPNPYTTGQTLPAEYEYSQQADSSYKNPYYYAQPYYENNQSNQKSTPNITDQSTDGNKEADKNAENANEKMTDKFHDIMDCAGVSLKDEQERIYQSQDLQDSDYREDTQNTIDTLFDSNGIVTYVNLLARKKKLNVDETVYNALYLSLSRKLAEIVEKMDDACKTRVDYLSLVDEFEKNEHKKEEIEDENQDAEVKRFKTDPKSAEKDVKTFFSQINSELGFSQSQSDGSNSEKKSSAEKNALIFTNSLKIENDIKRQLWVLEEIERVSLGRILQKEKKKEEKKKPLLEREDIAVKKRLSNSVALAALGIQKKSWMSETKEKKKQSVFMSLYAPYNDKEMEKSITNRKITMDDYLFVMEKDKRYNKSVFILKEYFKK